jgi:hypothetical protein
VEVEVEEVVVVVSFCQYRNLICRRRDRCVYLERIPFIFDIEKIN